MNTVCKGCPDRRADPNCHITCEKYIKEKQDNDKNKKERRYRNEVDDWYFDSLARNNKRRTFRLNKKH